MFILGMQNMAKLFPLHSQIAKMKDRIQEIKYTDEMDYIVEGLDNDEIDESLRLVIDSITDERFKTYMKESRHLEEMIQIMSRKKISVSASNMILEILFQVFNPYSFVDFEGLFRILMVIFDGLLMEGTLFDASSCIKPKIKSIIELLGRIPIKWYPGLSKSIELKKIVFILQICMSKRIVKWNEFLLSLLMECPEFELSEDFIRILLRKGRNYEILANYTTLEANVGRLSLSPSFKECLKKAVLREFVKSKGPRILGYMKRESSSYAVPSIPRHKREEMRILNRRKYLMIILINLISRNFCLDIPLDLIVRAYHTVDEVTRCYMALFLLIFVQDSEKNSIQNAYIEDLKKNARCLIFDCSAYLNEDVLSKIVKKSS
ncbi:hypothetical protein EROM_021420 [Encephalitozoon romaleae SJ-2008]|uniref:Uncharacterized protein n=1 Tax=Encephalitozoon romaleae (strain SJ-2008) TaxID=1178016 RepID=I7AQL9_ENCRO|nr:hypothetical protein EROM_021420 [Encephalitozoon romaleae SJ-2008]AFN82617.1 hypothetical protein EROM_021420 [Encephalitozoon romaleae SJ-2008]